MWGGLAIFLTAPEGNRFTAKLVGRQFHKERTAFKGDNQSLLSAAQDAQLAEIPVGVAQDVGRQSSRESCVGKLPCLCSVELRGGRGTILFWLAG